MEESMLNFVRERSIKNMRDDPNSRFGDIRIKVDTKRNNGVIDEYTNKCCFLSIFDGLGALKIKHIANDFEITPINLLLLAEFTDQREMIDTYNDKHMVCLNNLIGFLPDVQFAFYIGRYESNGWYTTPDPSVTIGNGKKIIRILNKGLHFEYITTDPSKFIRSVRTMTSELARMYQLEVEQKNVDNIKSTELALRLQRDIEEEEKRQNETARRDMELALKLQKEEEDNEKEMEIANAELIKKLIEEEDKEKEMEIANAELIKKLIKEEDREKEMEIANAELIKKLIEEEDADAYVRSRLWAIPRAGTV